MFAASVFILALMLSAPSIGQTAETGAVALTVSGERLTLRAKDVPLAVILERLATATGIAISCKEPPEERVTTELAEVSLEEGIQRLLQHRDTLFVYGKDRRAPSAVYVFGLHGGVLAGLEASPWAAASAKDGEEDFEAEKVAAAVQLESLEEKIRLLVEVGSPAALDFLNNLIADPQPSVRITALHWLARGQDAPIDSLATALVDSEYLVQSVAMQIMRDYQMSDQQIEEVMEVADAGDERLVRQRLSTFLTHQ